MHTLHTFEMNKIFALTATLSMANFVTSNAFKPPPPSVAQAAERSKAVVLLLLLIK